MIRRIRLPAAALCAVALAATPLAASAVDAATSAKAPTSPDQPRPRSGSYQVVKRGATLTRVRCAEGGNVMVPTHGKATAAQRDREFRDACKNLDYTK
jgi:hypothetical protein